jgi:hypothetical protein
VAQALAADPVCTDWRAHEQFAYRPEPLAEMPVLLLRGVDRSARHAGGKPASVPAPAQRGPQLGRAAAADHVAHVEEAHAARVEAVVGFLRRPR